MKKFLLLMLVVCTGVASSCKYDDDELWGSVDDLANRISAMETLTQQMNSDIAALQAIVTAVENQVAVSEVEKLTDGYILHFTNGQTATIKNGIDGEDGKDGEDGENGTDGADGEDGQDGKDGQDAPSIYIAKDNGVYYWTITVNGKTEWLTDEAGNKLPVTGADGADGEDGKDGYGSSGAAGQDGRTPTLKIDEDGNWMVSYDGTNFTEVVGSANAFGETGTDGTEKFESAGPTADGQQFVIKMKTGEEFVLNLVKLITFYNNEVEIEDTKNIEWNGEQEFEFTFDLQLKGAKSAVVIEEGIKVEQPDLEKKTISLTSINSSLSEVRAVVLFFNETQTITTVFKFKTAPWDGTTASPELVSLGDEGEIWGIATAADLKRFAYIVNGNEPSVQGRAATTENESYEGATFKLINDIDLSEFPWEPIGLTRESAFKGTFDGNGKTIKGLKVVNIGTDESGITTGAGLFGVVEDATVKGLTVTDAKVELTGNGVEAAGLIVGRAYGSVTLENITVEKETTTGEADVNGAAQNVGSIAGYIESSDVTIKGCEVKSASLTASSTNGTTSEDKVAVGGVVGTLNIVNDGSGNANLNIEGNKVGGVDLSTSTEGNTSTSAGGVVGALKVEETVNLTQTISGNTVSDTKTETPSEEDTPSTGESTATQTQGPVIGNMSELDAEISAGIIKDNTVGEDVKVETQLTVQNLEAVLNEALSASGVSTFTVKGSIEDTEEITIPAEGIDVTLNFDALATTSANVLVIKQGEGTTAAESTHQLTINMPTTDGGQYLTIEAPETTVTLASGYYAVVTSLTAKNTLVVEKEVTIENLYVEDGGVQVFGHVINLLRAEGNTADIELVIEEGGRVDNIPEEGVDVTDKNIKEDIKDDGDGNYTIYTAAGWKTFVSMINEGNTFEGKTIKLGADIDLKNELQEPIGVQEELDMNQICFAGTLDGQNHSIKNLKIDNSVGRFTGLFAYVQGATFKNLRIASGEVKGTGNVYVGAFLGYGRGVTLINCHNEGCKVIQSYEQNSGYSGGLTGCLHRTSDGSKYSFIIACTNAAEVSGAYCPSGITGGAWSGYINVVACVNTGKISYSGTSDLSSWGVFAAGISGAMGGSNANWMYGCFTDCEIAEGNNHAALIGDAGTSHPNLHYSYSANTSIPLLGQIWGTANKTIGYSSYNDAVDNLNKGIQMYNWTATVPCAYKFVKGENPTLVEAEPSTNPGAGNNNFGSGGKF